MKIQPTNDAFARDTKRIMIKLTGLLIHSCSGADAKLAAKEQNVKKARHPNTIR